MFDIHVSEHSPNITHARGLAVRLERPADDGAFIRCCVEDTGEGIPADYLDRVFVKFEQVMGNRKGGTGLGLTIARFFVEQHLGRIWVESEVGRGSRFFFTVPKGLVSDPSGGVRVAGPAA